MKNIKKFEDFFITESKKIEKNIEKNLINYLLRKFDNKHDKKIKETVKDWLKYSDNWKKAYYLTGEERKKEVLDVLFNKANEIIKKGN